MELTFRQLKERPPEWNRDPGNPDHGGNATMMSYVLAARDGLLPDG